MPRGQSTRKRHRTITRKAIREGRYDEALDRIEGRNREQDRVASGRTRKAASAASRQLRGPAREERTLHPFSRLLPGRGGYGEGTQGRRRSTNILDRRGKDHR